MRQRCLDGRPLRRLPALRLGAAGLAGLLASAAPAHAGEPVAIVEEIQAAGNALRVMDYLEAGQRIELHPGESLILGYLASCWRERITGGVIVVGTEQSEVQGGQVKRSRVECDGGNLQLSQRVGGESGVLVLRAPEEGKPAGAPLPPPDLVIYGTQPLIRLAGSSGPVTIERLDKGEAPIELFLERRYLDLATTKWRLAAGGVYRAKSEGRALVISVDRRAAAGPGPVLGRLVRL
ncbi:MAG TPA: hypothetical protein VFE11_00125 [Dongiaceae bacterium]|nr:hypothetical protein [Dongiaceae bacterium]